MKKVRIVPSILALVAGASLAMAAQQGQTPQAQWPTYGGNLASQRYASLDQINKDNFSQLQIAWRFKTNNLGPNPDNLYSATPLMVNGLLYTTAGTRRAVVALDPGTGEMIWMYKLDEGLRGQTAARNGAGRGVSYWSSPDGSDQRIIHSHTIVFAFPNTPSDLALPGPDNAAGLLRSAAATAVGRSQPLPAATPGVVSGTSVQGLPLIKPPYDRITAYDMNTGAMLWQKTHSSTPDNIKDNPALKGLDLPRLGQPGRTFIGVLTTKTLVIAGEGGVHTNAANESVALLRAYDRATGEDISGEVNMPARQTGSPMTYMYNGKQYIAVTVTGAGANAGGEILAYTLP